MYYRLACLLTDQNLRLSSYTRFWLFLPNRKPLPLTLQCKYLVIHWKQGLYGQSHYPPLMYPFKMITTMTPARWPQLPRVWIPHASFNFTVLLWNATSIIWNDTNTACGSSGGMSGCNHCILNTARSKGKGGQIPLIPFLEQASIECNLLCLLQSNTRLVFGLFRSDFDCLQLSSLQPY